MKKFKEHLTEARMKEVSSMSPKEYAKQFVKTHKKLMDRLKDA